MNYKEIENKILTENLYIKEIFYAKKNIYEVVNIDYVRVFNITCAQYKKLSKQFNMKVVKEDYSGFTKRYYKLTL